MHVSEKVSRFSEGNQNSAIEGLMYPGKRNGQSEVFKLFKSFHMEKGIDSFSLDPKGRTRDYRDVDVVLLLGSAL